MEIRDSMSKLLDKEESPKRGINICNNEVNGLPCILHFDDRQVKNILFTDKKLRILLQIEICQKCAVISSFE